MPSTLSDTPILLATAAGWFVFDPKRGVFRPTTGRRPVDTPPAGSCLN